jgi:hypothetical protein
MADIDIGEPVDLTLASGEQVQVVRIGSAIGLGVAASGNAAMATLYPAEAIRLAAELTRAAAAL